MKPGRAWLGQQRLPHLTAVHLKFIVFLKRLWNKHELASGSVNLLFNFSGRASTPDWADTLINPKSYFNSLAKT